MKTLFALLLATFLLAAEASASVGPGPWASGAYYPGGTDGKYQAAAYGNNITGVIGFAIREGNPTVLQQTNATATAGGGGGGTIASGSTASFSAATAAAQAFDATQNYFVIFVEGRTYSGLAVGSVNPVGKTVTGALLGAQPDFSLLTNSAVVTNQQVSVVGSNPVITIETLPGTTVTNINNETIIITNNGIVTETNIAITNVVTIDPTYITNTNFNLIYLTNFTESASAFAFTTSPNLLPILNRGLSGGFQAKLKNKKAYMTFRGDGQLSTPAQGQTINLATNAAGNNVSGTIETHTVGFKVDGLRTSFSTTLAPSVPTAGSAGN
jgi:hypothetical protein